ncbi:MAG: tyrosine-type recombinase/integrase [Acidimicrobiales bacterium]
MGRNRFGRLWRATVARSGLPVGTRYHDLRYHFASGLIAANCSVKTVQDALGHASAGRHSTPAATSGQPTTPHSQRRRRHPRSTYCGRTADGRDLGQRVTAGQRV